MIIVNDCHSLPCSSLIPTFRSRLANSNSRNLEEPWKQCKDSSYLIYQMGLKISSDFSMTKSGNTPCTMIPTCLLAHCEGQIRMPPGSTYSLLGLSSWLHHKFRHSRKIHSCLNSTSIESNCFIFYYPSLKRFFFLSHFSLVQFLNSPSLL